MAPKKNAKKGKRVDDEDFWAEKEAKIVDPLAAAESEEVDVPQPAKGGKKGAKKSAFELLQELEGGAVAEDDDFSPTANAPEVANMDDEWPEEDIKPKKGKKKGGKKSKQADLDDDDDMDGSATPAVEEVPTPAAPEVANIDDEWPEEDVKPKKGKKKGGKKSKSADLEDDDMDVATPEVETVAAPAATPAAEEVEAAPSPAAPGTPAEPADGEEEGGIKILSKKEKERLKKEKEKAKKKAQAAAKKGNAPAALTETPAPQEAAPQDDQNDAGADDAEETGAGASDKKKKKKKKAATVEEKKEEPAGKPKKVNARVAALQAALAEQKALEEAARRQAEEDERLRLEEEAKIAEEERKVEEEKQRRKDKERAKREQLRKDGKLLTAKQKREQQMAALRKEQLLASGVVIEGLQNQDVEKPKKVVYGNKKKQQPKKAEPSPAPTPVAAPEPEKKDTAAAGSDDDWDKSDDEKVEELTQAVEKTQIQDSDDDWDKSSDEEEEPVKPAATPAKAAPGANGKVPASTNGKTAAAAKPTGKPAAKAAEESSSEEESDSEDDSEDDSDDSSDDSDDDSDDSDDSSEPERQTEAQKKAQAEKEQRIQEAAARRAQRHQEALAARSKDDLRSPICCILGHVDTGKTKLLDKIRQTNVQEGEAGGITQQIGATYFPLSAIKEKTQVVNKDNSFDFKVPGLLIIDTPGHESFTNLRSRGSSLCNIAILVVDITHGLEPQTLESIRLLKERKTPFIVALNKIDRCYGWKEIPNGSFRDTFAQQSAGTKREFETRLQATKLAFAEQGFNSELYYENKDLGRTVSLVPTSAITGEGVPDMIMLLIQLTQQRMTERLMYISELECTVLEVKVIEGLGTTIDVILSNGVMREGDRIVVCGMDGAIATNVRALLTPQPLRELRVKSQYVHHKEVKAALGIKIAAPGLEKAVAGCRLFVVGPDDDEDEIKLEAEKDFKSMEEYIDKDKRGVYVQASTLGSLEALLEFLRSSKIPVANISIGPVYRKDIVKASAQLEKNPEYAVVLCFDVPVDKDAKAMAEELNVKVFEAQIIYHLFDAFTAYMNEVVEARKRDAAPNAVWPVRLKTLRAFAKRDPIVLGVDIIEGSLRVGTPICVVKLNKETGKKDIIPLGKITSIEINHVTKDVVKKAQIGAGAAIKIEHAVYQSSKAFGRHFDEKDELISHISRQSIDVLKTNFRKEADLSDWALIKQLKTRLDIA